MPPNGLLQADTNLPPLQSTAPPQPPGISRESEREAPAPAHRPSGSHDSSSSPAAEQGTGIVEEAADIDSEDGAQGGGAGRKKKRHGAAKRSSLE